MELHELETAIDSIGDKVEELQSPIDRLGDKLEDITDAIKTMPDRAIAVDCRVYLDTTDLKAIMTAIILQGMLSNPKIMSVSDKITDVVEVVDGILDRFGAIKL